MGDIQGCKELRTNIASNLFITDDQFFENLDKMERLYTLQEWRDIESELVRKMRGEKFSPLTCSRRYVRYLVRKGSLDELYNICLHQPALLDDFHEILRPRYEKELGVIFERYVLHIARCGSHMSKYKETCELFKKYHSLGIDTRSAIEKLRNWYRNRPTLMKMLDELELD
jgi:hypothetical protein